MDKGKRYTEEEIREKLREFTQGPVQSFWAEVQSVSEADRTAIVLPADDSPELEVLLKSNFDSETSGITEIPAENSQVIVSILNNDPDTAFISKCSVVEKVLINGKVVFNEGEKGGLPIVNKVAELFNKIFARIDALEQFAATHVHIAAAPGSPTATATPPFVPNTPEQVQASQIENPDVSQ